jgi:restriction endonuclease S subunit
MKTAWPRASLSNTITLNRSGFWGQPARDDTNSVEVKVVRNGDITREGDLRGFATRYFTSRQAGVSRLLEGDIAVTTSGDVGKAWLVDRAGYFASNFVRILRPDTDKILPSFLRYALDTDAVREELVIYTMGTTIQNLQGAFYDAASFALPPLREQQRIVAILDDAFAAIAMAKASAERNLENARRVFDGQLNAVFGEQGSGWKERRLGDVATTQYGLSLAMNEDGKGYKIFRMGELQDGRLVDTGRMKFADITRSDFEKYRLRPGDVLFNRTNSFELVGKTGLFDLLGDYCFASYLIRILPDETAMLSDFMNYMMNSERFQTSVKQKASRSINQANINATIVANEVVCIPASLHEQSVIVSRLDQLREEGQRLVSVYQRKLAALDELKQSLLHQAFTGQLTKTPEADLEAALA